MSLFQKIRFNHPVNGGCTFLITVMNCEVLPVYQARQYVQVNALTFPPGHGYLFLLFSMVLKLVRISLQFSHIMTTILQSSSMSTFRHISFQSVSPNLNLALNTDKGMCNFLMSKITNGKMQFDY